MIYRSEILDNRDCPEELEDNLLDLLIKINKVRDAWGKPMTVSSGWRSRADQIRIYRGKGITDEAKMHMKSKHFFCQAVDIADPKQELQKWIIDNISLIAQIGLWMEDFSATKNWIHFQSVPPGSGKRFFLPG